MGHGVYRVCRSDIKVLAQYFSIRYSVDNIKGSLDITCKIKYNKISNYNKEYFRHIVYKHKCAKAKIIY